MDALLMAGGSIIQMLYFLKKEKYPPKRQNSGERERGDGGGIARMRKMRRMERISFTQGI